MTKPLGLNVKVARAPAWNPVGKLIERTWLEPVEVATGSRLSLPVEVRRCLDWPSAGEYLSLLAAIRSNDAVELVLWEPVGRTELERVERAIADEAEEERHDLALAAMDRYYRVALTPDGRMRLPRALLVHLDATEGQFVRVATNAGRLWLWPERVWGERRAARFRQLDRVLSTESGWDGRCATA